MEKKRVVVIGNHWETQMMATCALEGAGYDAITLFDKRHALQAVLDVRPDLVLLDMADRRTQDVPIIGIVPPNEHSEAAMAGGGLVSVFSRPLDNRLLIRKVRKVLQDDRQPTHHN